MPRRPRPAPTTPPAEPSAAPPAGAATGSDPTAPSPAATHPALGTRHSALGSAPSTPDDLVPSRRQYLDIKAQHPGALVLYQIGDFYEAFDDDARILARDARVTLTSRSFGRSGRVPLAGVPHHALNHYLGRLLAAGHTVAVAEQVEPAGKGLVRREVTRVLSPGVVADGALLPPTETRWLAAVAARGERIGLSWLDASTGDWAVAEWRGDGAASALAEELARLNPAETLVPDDLDDAPWRAAIPGHVRRVERWPAEPERAADALKAQFGAASLVPFGCDGLPAAVGAAGLILARLEETDPALLPLLTGLRTAPAEGRVGLDAATRRNLEIVRSLGTGGSRGSLLGVVEQPATAMGARALRRLLGEPLRDLDRLRARQALIAALVAAPAARRALAALLAAAGDLERVAGRVAIGRAAPRDLLLLRDGLRQTAPIRDALATLPGGAGEGLPEALPDPCEAALAGLERAVEADGEGIARIRPGFSAELDQAQEAASGTRGWLAGLEAREREHTGIRSLKVGFNKVFGYYLEVTRPNLGLVPADWRRKQTVANGERFVTAELKDAESRLLAADEEIAALEKAAVAQACAAVAADVGRLQRAAAALATLDALLALAETAARRGWTAPELSDGDHLLIRGGRHPVVEDALAGDPFIPNDCLLGDGHPRQVVVTGPNMGGKSTWLRQVGVVVLLAQIGSFVPAIEARIGLVDRICTRVGAHDDLARGRSTFMVEMTETAAILHGATSRSLLLLDEIGRGTGTADGLAIAQAVLEDIAARIGARCLFATHYLELTAVAEALPTAANAHVGALETAGRVVFLYAVQPGPADRAYGVQVARLAGLPPWVADRAEHLLDELRSAAPATIPPGGSAGDARAPAASAGAPEDISPDPGPAAAQRGVDPVVIGGPGTRPEVRAPGDTRHLDRDAGPSGEPAQASGVAHGPTDGGRRPDGIDPGGRNPGGRDESRPYTLVQPPCPVGARFIAPALDAHALNAHVFDDAVLDDRPSNGAVLDDPALDRVFDGPTSEGFARVAPATAPEPDGLPHPEAAPPGPPAAEIGIARSSRPGLRAAEPPSRYDAGAVPENDPPSPPPTPAEVGSALANAALRLAADLRALDLDGITAREALAWLWDAQARLGLAAAPNPDADADASMDDRPVRPPMR